MEAPGQLPSLPSPKSGADCVKIKVNELGLAAGTFLNYAKRRKLSYFRHIKETSITGEINTS